MSPGRLVKARKDWRSAERLMAGLFLYGVGDRRGREESGEAVEVCECMMYGVCISVISVKNVYYTYT